MEGGATFGPRKLREPGPQINRNVAPSSEVCDSLDNNCDGSIDEGVRLTFYRDADGDGHGSSATTTQGCTAPSGYVASSDD